GDSTFSVFARATDAVTAAVEMQRALSAEQWPGELTLGTRVALHAGEAQFRDGDYFGPAPTRAARIRGLAVGGQILCSQSVAHLVPDALPDGTELSELGPQKLRGLKRPEIVYELRHADTEDPAPIEFGDMFPSPVARIAPVPDEEPRGPMSFVGRA